MSEIAAANIGGGTWTLYGKQQIGIAMYKKGKAFVGTAVLISRQGSSEPVDYVALYLLCQGFEVMLKGLLLLRDYDRFKGRLKPIGHDLLKLAHETSNAYGMKLRPAVLDELRTISQLYLRNLLRYGTGYDIFVDPRTIPREKVLHWLVAVIRLTERELGRL